MRAQQVTAGFESFFGNGQMTRREEWLSVLKGMNDRVPKDASLSPLHQQLQEDCSSARWQAFGRSSGSGGGEGEGSICVHGLYSNALDKAVGSSSHGEDAISA
jgi:hypothetical protein